MTGHPFLDLDIHHFFSALSQLSYRVPLLLKYPESLTKTLSSLCNFATSEGYEGVVGNLRKFVPCGSVQSVVHLSDKACDLSA